MEQNLQKNDTLDKTPKDIVLSRSVAAGKRIYYIDIKQNTKGEHYVVLTESKKVKIDEGTDSELVQFEKHKIFLYKEDFAKFSDALGDIIAIATEFNSKCD